MSRERDIIIEMIEKREKQLDLTDRALLYYNNNAGALQEFDGIAMYDKTADSRESYVKEIGLLQYILYCFDNPLK